MSKEYHPSQEKQHYESLLKFFKNLVWGISILTAVGAFIIGRSVADIKSNLETEIVDLKDQIAKLENSTNQTLLRNNEISESYLENLRKNTESYINHSKYITTQQIDAIKEEAKYLALQAAKNRIEETFKYKNIEGFIDDVANDKIDNEIEILIDEQLENIIQTLEFVPELTMNMDGIRSGLVKSYYQLDSISKYHESEIVRNSARKVLIEKAPDYFTPIGYDYIFSDESISNITDRLGLDAKQFNDRNYTSKKSRELKIKILQDGTDPNDVGIYYQGLVIMNKIDTIRMFDFEQLKRIRF